MRRQLGPLGWQLLAENELTGLSHTHDALDATAEVDKELFVLSALPKEFPIQSTITGNATREPKSSGVNTL